MNNLKVVFSIPEKILTNVNERLASSKDRDGRYSELIIEIIRDEIDNFITDDNSSFMKDIIPQISDLIEYEFYRNEFMKSIESAVDNTPLKQGRGKRVRHGRHAKTK